MGGEPRAPHATPADFSREQELVQQVPAQSAEAEQRIARLRTPGDELARSQSHRAGPDTPATGRGTDLPVC